MEDYDNFDVLLGRYLAGETNKLNDAVFRDSSLHDTKFIRLMEQYFLENKTETSLKELTERLKNEKLL